MNLTPPFKFTIIGKLNGSVNSFVLSWDKSFLADSYKLYHSYTPYGLGSLIWQGTTFTFEHIPNTIMGTVSYYRVCSVKGTQEVGTPWATIEDLSYIDSSNTHIETTEGIKDPHTNLYPNGESSFKPGTTNTLPSRIGRRSQLNRIRKNNLWVLQDIGEPVFLLKPKRYNYSQPDPMQERLINREDKIKFYPAIPIWVKIVPKDAKLEPDKDGFFRKKEPRSWTIIPPYIETGDYIVSKRNERFEITSLTLKRSWNGVDTWQEWDSILLPKTDRIYNHPQIKDLDYNVLNNLNIANGI